MFGRYRLLIGTLAIALFLDQGTKALAQATLRPGEVVPVIGDMLDLRLRQNEGVAWGLGAGLPGSVQRVLFPAAAALIGAALVLLYRRQPAAARASRCAIALIVGGGAGNFVDRVRLGYVVDFIAVHLVTPAWTMSGTFNLADAAMVGGFATLVVAIGTGRDGRGRAEAEGGST